MNAAGLTLEEQATNAETSKHIRLVGKLLHLLVKDLLDRADAHDLSKLERPEVELFTKFTPLLAGLTYGSKEFNECKAAMGPALAHHYANNSHHPEFYRQDEEWRPVTVDGFTGYLVSSYGRVRPSGGGPDMAQYRTPKGYCRLQLWDGSLQRQQNFLAHRLVAMAFIPNPDDKPEVNHKNGHKFDNRATNLEWVTESENLQHAYEEGLKKANIKYVVTCDTLGFTTNGCNEMALELRRRGYEKANAPNIWRCINKGGKHLDLEFTGTRFERWMASPVNEMTLVDLIEMFCDWKASSLRHNDGDIRKSILINAERFDLDPQLARILENTAALTDGVTG